MMNSKISRLLRLLEGRSPLDPYLPGAGPESPLPYVAKASDGRQAMNALKEMSRTAEVVGTTAVYCFNTRCLPGLKESC